MASSDRRAYVYLQLPQSLEVVTAGFYELDFPQGVPIGSFVYNPTYLQRADAVPLDPYELPLAPRRKQTVKLKGIFGALRDASPDAWGRRIIEKHTVRTDSRSGTGLPRTSMIAANPHMVSTCLRTSAR